jgi:O-methyltransferase
MGKFRVEGPRRVRPAPVRSRSKCLASEPGASATSLASVRIRRPLQRAPSMLEATECDCSMQATDLREAQVTNLYLSLLKGCLTRSVLPDESFRDVRLDLWLRGWPARALAAHNRYRKQDWRIVKPHRASAENHAVGESGARSDGETMIGHARLDNIQRCVTSVLADDVPGDLIEAGVWRGGAAILMRAILACHGVSDRRVWLADSFEGLPEPRPDEYPADEGLDIVANPLLAVGVEQVKANFARYGLVDDNVQFLLGWFKDTLPTAPIEQLALVRLDGDLYESTLDAITALFRSCRLVATSSLTTTAPQGGRGHVVKRSATTERSTTSSSQSKRSTGLASTGVGRSEQGVTPPASWASAPGLARGQIVMRWR